MPTSSRTPAARRLLVATVASLVLALLPEPAAHAHLLQADDPACAGLQAVTTSDGLVLCHHGDDGHLHRHHTAPADGEGFAAARAPDPGRLVCDAAADAPAVQVVHVRASSGRALDDALVTQYTQAAIGVQAVYDRSSRAHGANRALLPRFAADANCSRVAVLEQVVSPAALDSFGQMIDEVRDAGLSRDDRVYLLMADSGTYCGIATLAHDDRPDPAVNRSAQRAGYARVDVECVGYAETHEITHALGGVQPTAPNATAGGHCSDGHDVMCYDDGTASASPYSTSACPDSSARWLLDCGGDDYFNPTSPTGYLAEHYNVADSPVLFPAALGATSTQGSDSPEGPPSYLAGATPVMGDWDGDGQQTPGLFRDGRWILFDDYTGRSGRELTYGRAGDTPVVGDWDGDGIETIGVVRGNRFILRNKYVSGDVALDLTYGRASDTPVVGDWDGDGVTTIGVVRGNVFILRNVYRSGADDIVLAYGRDTDTPVVGDWDGNGTTTLGVVRGNRWILRNVYRSGADDIVMDYGRDTDTPVVGDYDGDGDQTLGVERDGTWILRNRYGKPYGDIIFGR